MSDQPLTSSEHDRRIDYLELAVIDVARAKRFYEAAFGWAFTDYGPDYSSFADGRLTGGLRKDASVATGSVLVVLFALGLADCQKRILAAGGRITKDTFSFPGGRRFHFVDTEGTEMAVWSDR